MASAWCFSLLEWFIKSFKKFLWWWIGLQGLDWKLLQKQPMLKSFLKDLQKAWITFKYYKCLDPCKQNIKKLWIESISCVMSYVSNEVCNRYSTLLSLWMWAFLLHFQLYPSPPQNLLPFVYFCAWRIHVLKTQSIEDSYALFTCIFDYMTLCISMDIKHTFYFVMFVLINYNDEDTDQ